MKRTFIFLTVVPILLGVLLVTPYVEAATCTNLTRLLYRGSRDTTTAGQVSQLQRFLAQQGYFNYEVTGYFGTITERAVQTFQRAYRVVSSGNPATTGYGLVGPRTRSKIKLVSGCPQPPGRPPEPIPQPNPVVPEDPAMDAPVPPADPNNNQNNQNNQNNNQNNNNNNQNNNNTSQPQTPTPGGGQTFNFTFYKDKTLNTYADNAVIWFTIGGASTYERFRSVLPEGSALPASYYRDSFAFTRAQPLALGYQRALIHNPFGFSAHDTFPNGCQEEGMQFDQYLEAQQDAPWLTNGFVEYWKPYVDQGMEIIAYVGSIDPFTPDGLNGDCDQRMLENDQTAYWQRAYAAIQPYLDAGMSIGFDAAVATNSSSATYLLAQQLRARGVRVYVEAIPGRDNPHWAEYPFVIYEDNWWFHTQDFAMPLNQLNRDIFRFVTYPADHETQVRNIIRDGYTSSAIEDEPLRQGLPDNVAGLFTIDVPIAGALPSTNYRVTVQPAHGSVVADTNVRGRYHYSPHQRFVGSDSFTFVITNSGSADSAPNVVNISVVNQEPFVTAAQMMTAVKQASGATKVIATWPLVEREINALGIRGMVSSSMVPKRVITMLVGGSPVSYIAGYNKNTYEVMVGQANRVLAGAPLPGETQLAGAAEGISFHPIKMVRGWWYAVIRFWERTLFGVDLK